MLSDKSIEIITNQSLKEVAKILSKGVSSEITTHYGIATNIIAFCEIVGDRMLCKTMSKFDETYNNSKYYKKDQQKIFKKIKSFVYNTCDLTTGFFVKNYGRLKSAINVLSDISYDNLIKNCVEDLKKMEPSYIPKIVAESIDKDEIEKGDDLFDFICTDQIEKLNITPEKKKEIKKDKQILKTEIKNNTDNIVQIIKNGGLKIMTYRNKLNLASLIKTTNEMNEMAFHIGVIFKDHNMTNIAIVGTNTMKVAEGIIGIMDAGPSLASGNLILAGISGLSLFFKKNVDATKIILDGIKCVQELINLLHKDIMLNFARVFETLADIKYQIIVGFQSLNLDIENIFECLAIINDKIEYVNKNVMHISHDIVRQFNNLSDRMTIDKVSETKTLFIQTIHKINMSDKDLFESSLKELITICSVQYDSLCGYKDGNISRMLNRLKSLSPIFNINSILDYIKKYNVYLILPFHIKKYISSIDKTKTTLNISNILMANMITSDIFEDETIYPLYNKGLWSVYVVTDGIKSLYCHNTDNIYDLVPEPNYYYPINKKVYELGLYICNLIAKLTNTSIIKEKDICLSPIDITGLNNELCFAICLTEIIGQIEKQRDETGCLPTGFISSSMFNHLTDIAEQTCFFYDVQVFFRNENLYKKILQDYKKEYLLMSSNIKLEVTKYKNNLTIELNLKYRSKMTKLLKFKLKEYMNQNINIKWNYPSWFKAWQNHYAGKFSGSDSWGPSYLADNPRDAQQWLFSSAYVTHMTEQIVLTKRNISTWIIKSFDNPEMCAERYTLIGQTPKYIMPFIYHESGDNVKYPILTMNSFYFGIWNEPIISQKITNNIITFKYCIEDNNFVIKLYCVDLNKPENTTDYIFKMSKPYDPLFYEGSEAIWYYWYGGMMPIDGHVNTWTRENLYSDNRSTTYVEYPVYKSRMSNYINFSQVTSKDKTLNVKQWGKILVGIESKIRDFETDIIKIIKDNNTIYQNVDFYYHLIKSMLCQAGYDHILLEHETSYPNIIKCSDHLKTMTIKLFEKYDYTKITYNWLLDESITNFDKYVYLTCDNISTQNKPIKNWLSVTNIEDQFIGLIKEIIPTITCKYMPSEKEKWISEMNTLLFKLLEVSQNKPNTFKSFDILSFISNVKKSFDDKIKSGTVGKYGFIGHVRESFELLKDIDKTSLLSLSLF
jgi:hypothetical protein